MTASKSQAREKIKKLIEKYERIKKAKQIRRYDEANTRKDFIMPLFQALGWDTYNEFTEREVVEEETAVKGKVDYSFRLNNIPQFLLEAKALRADLDKVEWAKQAVTYGWNKGIPWVVLTDFEGLKLFNSEWLVETPRPNLEFTYGELLARIDDLWFLSRGSIEKGELDKQAEKWGIKTKRSKVTEKLATDLLKWRGWLYEVFRHFNKEETEEVVNESVQKVLDRFIFIRACEDRKLEPEILWEALRTWITHNRKPDNFMQELKPIFKKFKDDYNSNLFEPHPCERLDCYGEPFEKIIEDLYADIERGVKYDFSAIPADVLGSIYEQYLGYIQKKGVVNGTKRKKHGIYYTPEFIVDYIVQNTLGVALKEKPLREIESIKILDPACGSGSFLIKAFNLLDEKLAKEKAQEKSGPQAAFRKFNILKNNIYGVDLDPQAIEIARLNLLLKALEPNHKLPLLDNTRVGNSLISGTEKQLKRYFGEKWEKERPFNWKEEFIEIFKKGGFDVIIGNPPYVFTREGDFREEAKEYFKTYYLDKIKLESKSKAIQSGKLNLFALFLIRSVDLLKEDGILGFIIPNTFLRVNTYIKLRKFILENCKILKIVDTGVRVFEGVTSSTVIIILQKESNERYRNKNKIGILKLDGKEEPHEVGQIDFYNNKNYVFNIVSTKRYDAILEKIEKNTIPLGKIGQSFNGIATKKDKNKYISDKPKSSRYKPLLEGKDIKKYGIEFKNKYIVYDRKLLHRPRDEKIFLNKEKIITQRIGGGSGVIIAALDNDQYYTFNSVNNIILHDKKFSSKYTLALLNSRLLNWYYVMKFTNLSLLTVNISKTNLEQLPIKIIQKSQQKPIIKLVDKILNLNKDLQKCAKDSDKYREIQGKIEKVDKQINQLAYKLYDLTPEEIEIVEKV